MSENTTLLALAGHAAGDFPLQTDEMAANKFDNDAVRAKHVTVYTASMLPFALACDWSTKQRIAFVCAIWGTHYGIDSRRWNDAVPVWYDQALHVIALAASTLLAGAFEE